MPATSWADLWPRECLGLYLFRQAPKKNRLTECLRTLPALTTKLFPAQEERIMDKSALPSIIKFLQGIWWVTKRKATHHANGSPIGMKVSDMTLISSAITGFSLEKCCVKNDDRRGNRSSKGGKRIYPSQRDF